MTDNCSHRFDYPRVPRKPFDGVILIKRPGKETIKCRNGNVSDIGLFLELKYHDLQKGRRVGIIFVSGEGSVKDINRMSGIVLRIDPEGVALMIYQPNELRKLINQHTESPISTVYPLKIS